jgi:hypothetical protein
MTGIVRVGFSLGHQGSQGGTLQEVPYLNFFMELWWIPSLYVASTFIEYWLTHVELIWNFSGTQLNMHRKYNHNQFVSEVELFSN